MNGDEVIWQDFNPIAKFSDIPTEWIFIDESLQDDTFRPFNPENPISANMRQLLFLMAGSFRPSDRTKLEFTPLAVTGKATGSESFQELMMNQRSGGMLNTGRRMTRDQYVVAAQVRGKVVSEDVLASKDEKAVDEADDSLVGKELKKSDLNVVLVADIDWIAPIIFELRDRGNDGDMPVEWQFQNVPFVLNILDSLAGDDRFIDLRKRTKTHRILTKIEDATEESRDASLKQQQEFIREATDQIEAAQKAASEKIDKMRNQPGVDPRVIAQQVEMVEKAEGRKVEVQIAGLKKERDSKIKQSERELASTIRGVQDTYKLLAVILPPIPPLLLALMVFFHRRKAEQEGVSASRLRYGKAPENANQGKS